ncbi:MAG: beta-propeller fold lactonase family protein [Gemmatimonadota bacterium]
MICRAGLQRLPNWLGALGAILVGAVPGCAQATSGGPAQAPFEGAAILYVCVQDEAEVAMIDMESHEVVGSVSLTELGFSPTSMPHDIAVEPDGSHWYVSVIGDNRVLRFDRQNRLVGQAPMETPGMMSIQPGTGRVAVSRSMSAVNPPTRLGLLEPDGMSMEEVDIFFPRPHGVVTDREGRYAYSASLGTNQVISLELDTEVVELVEVPGPTHAFVQLAISPDGTTLVASGELSGELVVFDLSEDRARPRYVRSIPVGQQAFDPIFSPDGASVWIPLKGADAVAVVGTANWAVETIIEGPGLLQPHAIAFSPDGQWAFVTNNNKDPHAMHHPGQADGGAGTVVIIDVAGREVTSVLELGRNVTGLGTRPVR